MDRIEEIFRDHQRHLRGVEPGAPDRIDELEKLVGRTLPGALRAYLRLAGGNPGNLTFVQTHKTIRPTLSEALSVHRPRRHGSRRKKKEPTREIFFGDGIGCQDCGAAWLILEPPEELPKLAIDPDDPPVCGYDYDELQVLAPRFTEYVLRAMPGAARHR
jgi:hypothetical protein